MNRITVPSVLTLALALCSAANVSKAAAQSFSNPPAATTTTTTSSTKAASGKIKLVSFSLRNAAGTTLTVQLGDQQLTIEPGKTVTIKAPAGQQIIATNNAGHATAGSVLSVVSNTLQGNTIVVN